MVLPVYEYTEHCFQVHGFAASAFRPQLERESRVDPTSPHGKLPRPPINDLPPPHTTDSVFVDDVSEKLYRDVYQGRCVLVWNHTFPTTEAISTGIPRIVVRVCEPPSDDSGAFKGLLNINMAFRPCETDQNESGGLHDKGLLSISSQQFNKLAIRASHMFLRLAGYDIGACAHLMFRWTKREYITCEWWKEAADLATMHADLAFETNQKNDAVQGCLQDISNVLTSSGRYTLAAGISKQLADLPWIGMDEQLQFYTDKAYLDMAAGSFDEAEKTIFRAYRLASAYFEGATINNMLFRRILSCAVALTAFRAHVDHLTFGATWTTNKIVYCLLKTIFIVIHGAGPNEIPPPRGMIDKKYLRVSTATKAVCEAFQCAAALPSDPAAAAEGFRTKVKLLSRAGVSLVGFKVNHSELFSFRIEELRHVAKIAAREKLLGVRRHCIIFYCDNVGCNVESNEMQVCAKCQDATYCSRECQLAHWPEHKTRCKMVRRALEAAEAAKTK